jgi:hypothetical protein
VLLDKARRNEIFETLLSAGRDPRDFELTGETLSHPASGSSLTVGQHGQSFIVRYWAGDADVVERPSLPWGSVLGSVDEWAEEIERYASMPDLWAELASDREVITRASAPDVENAPFTESERSDVVKQLAEIRRYAKTALRLSDQRMEELDGRLRYLEEATARVGRKDWLLIAIGTMFSIAVAAIIPPDEVRNLITIFLQPLGHLFGHAFPQLPPG